MRKLALLTLPVAIALGAASVASADSSGAIATRHAYFKSLGFQMKKMGEIAKSFDPAAAKAQAVEFESILKTDFKTLFPEGTSAKDIPADNGAKPEIWTNFDDFLAKEAAFKAAGAELVAAAQGTDAKAFGAAMGKTGGTCKACHDDYRLPQ
ncbi:c-type cytochrome [Paenirhodobacter sp.]|uniref:c-type cytochrome n=1 Tax=Paenirhodobacter sp. TaxID=1965326 RepID=UPI003B413EE8